MTHKEPNYLCTLLENTFRLLLFYCLSARRRNCSLDIVIMLLVDYLGISVCSRQLKENCILLTAFRLDWHPLILFRTDGSVPESKGRVHVAEESPPFST
jgi:hypothetical protein